MSAVEEVRLAASDVVVSKIGDKVGGVSDITVVVFFLVLENAQTSAVAGVALGMLRCRCIREAADEGLQSLL